MVVTHVMIHRTAMMAAILSRLYSLLAAVKSQTKPNCHKRQPQTYRMLYHRALPFHLYQLVRLRHLRRCPMRQI